jgi:hypothetical protein
MESPVRVPGQSLKDERERLVDDVILPYVLFPAIFWVVALIEWLSSAQHAPHQPKLFAACALIFSRVPLGPCLSDDPGNICD